MKTIKFDYLGLEEKLVQDKNNFYGSGIPSVTKLRNLIGTAQRIFMTSSRNVNLYVLGEGESFKIDLLRSDKKIITTLYYLPKEYRLDVYDASSIEPLFVWTRKQCVMKNIGSTLSTLGVEKLLLPLIANL